MSQHDLTIDNQGFPAFRSDLNNALQALGSTQSGTTAPSPTFANQLWYDTTNNQLKIRNEDNDAWISIVTLDQSADVTSGVGAKTLPTGDIVGTSDSQTLTNKTINATQLVDASVTPAKLSSAAQYTGFKNRIINGAMVIDQRNAGASITPLTSGTWYAADRFNINVTQSSKFTSQQSSTAPTEFRNSVVITSSSAYSIVSGDAFTIRQIIEGYNTADLGWGTANAKTVTLSFWVRSSLTGTFGGSFTNSDSSRSYPFSYTINAVDTWEQKTITVAGDTTGTWVGATNGRGMTIYFSLGTGTTYSGTAGSWSSNNYQSATGATSVVGTNGATFYITGVQLEVGSTATSFDYRPYGTELALCQRYYYKIFPAANSKGYGNGTSVGTTNIYNTVPSPVTMRVDPTLETTGTASDYAVVRGGGTNTACSSVPTITDQSHKSMLQVNGFLSSGLIDGYSGWLRTNSSSSYLAFNSEL